MVINTLCRTTQHVPSTIHSKSLYIVLVEAGAEPAYITGSVALGCATPTSDLDIVVPINFRERIVTALKLHGYIIAESHYNSGVKFADDCGRIINVVPLHPLDWHAWLWATQILAVKDMTVLDRNNRHRMFEFAVLAYKTLIAKSSDYFIADLSFGSLDYGRVIVTED